MHQDSDIWGNRYLTLNRIGRLVGAVGETSAGGGVGLLRDAVEEYFPLGAEVYDIDIEGETSSYTRKKSPSRPCSHRRQGRTTYRAL